MITIYERPLATAVLTAAVMFTGASAPAAVQWFGPPNITVHITPQGNNNYTVEIIDTMSGGNGGVVDVFSTLHGVDSITFLSVDNGASGIFLNLINPNNGNLLKSVKDIIPFDRGFVLAVLETTGDVLGTIDVGDSGSIGIIDAGGNISANIYAGNQISFIKADGDINGSIVCETGRILEVSAGLGGAGSIGAPGNPVAIISGGATDGLGTRKIIGDSIYADIDHRRHLCDRKCRDHH